MSEVPGSPLVIKPAQRSRHPVIVDATTRILLTLCLGVAAAAAQEAPRPAVHVHVLQHQRLDEAVQLVYRLLSEEGTVELRPGGSSLVIRDLPEAIERIVPILEDFDHPLRSVRLELKVVRAATGDGVEPAPQQLEEEVSAPLRELLRFDRFALLSRGAVTAREGEEVGLRLGGGYAVRFSLGMVMADERLRLRDFRLERGPGAGVANGADEPEPVRLVRTHLNLWLGEPMVLGLSRTEASDDALMVIVTAEAENEHPAVAARGEG
jgi:hypothetical protein